MSSPERLPRRKATGMQVLEAMLATDDDRGVRKDGFGTRLGYISLWFVAAGVAGGAGYLGIRPDTRPPVFAEIPFLDGAEVNCSDIVARYEPDDPDDLRIAGGASAIFEVSGYGHGLEFYFGHVDAVVVNACKAYDRARPNVAPGTWFIVDTGVVPRPDIGPDSLEVVATVTETEWVEPGS